MNNSCIYGMCLMPLLAAICSGQTIEMKSAAAWPQWWEFQSTITVDGTAHETYFASQPFAVSTGTHLFSAPSEISDANGEKYIFSHWERESTAAVIGYDAQQDLLIDFSDKIWAIYALKIEGVKNLKGVDFYPSQHSWDKMWTEWDAALISTELDFAKDLGCTVVETYIHYPVFYDEASETVSVVMLDRAKQFEQIAASKGIRVQFTLFDFVWDISSSKWAHHKKYLDEIVPALQSSALHSWGLKNEINLFLGNGPTVQEIVDWGTEMLNHLRSLDPVNKVEIEIARDGGGKGFEEAWFQPLLTKADWVGLSDYYYTGDYKQTMGDIIKVYADYGKPVVVSEYGWTTYGATPTEEQAKLDKYNAIHDNIPKVASKLGTGLKAWCLMDYASASSESEKRFGLVSFAVDGSGSVTYSPKTAYAPFKAWVAPVASASVPAATSKSHNGGCFTSAHDHSPFNVWVLFMLFPFAFLKNFRKRHI